MSESHAPRYVHGLLIAWLAAFPALPASGQSPIPTLDDETIERIDAFVAREVIDSGLPGVAIAVLRDGHAPYVRGFGHDGKGRAITGDTPFPIGSLTKSFTALLIRQEIEAGRLDADAPVQHYPRRPLQIPPPVTGSKSPT